MITRSTWLHLRFPFSFFLLPIFLFGLCVTPDINVQAAISMCFILHFLLYPASNGYNSYFDKDQQSIGGLKNPPQVSRELYWVSLALDLGAIIWGAFIHWQVAWMLLVYGLVSKAYSHPGIRLKKYPYLGWGVAGLFQGAFTLLMVVLAVHPENNLGWHPKVWGAALLSTLLLWGSFPMTQVYQHQEDARRGDVTISRKLGIRGTFLFTMVVFLLANVAFVYYFLTFESLQLVIWFILAMLPIMGYFLYWMFQVWKDPAKADFAHTMRLNFISSFFLNLFFGLWLFLSSG